VKRIGIWVAVFLIFGSVINFTGYMGKSGGQSGPSDRLSTDVTMLGNGDVNDTELNYRTNQ